MFELPEFTILANQIDQSLTGKTIQTGTLGNSPHKFVWYNRSPEEFTELVTGRSIGTATVQGRWMSVQILPGYVLVLGECGGKMLYHPPGSKLPPKYHLYLEFDDGSFFTETTQMWGAMELYRIGEEQQREYIKDMRTTPVDDDFTLEYYNRLVDSIIAEGKKSVKGLLTQDQLIPGLGNAIAQDIMFNAGLHPRHDLADLNEEQRTLLYEKIISTVQEVIIGGGRNDEFDLYNQRGGYTRKMDRNAVNNPCPNCGTSVEKIQYLGGACYFCPDCQV